jgi:hypothetical protein
MNPSDDSLDPRLEEKLSVLLTVAPRDPGVAARGRANYLSQAQSLKTTVSQSSQWRHKRWMSSFTTIFSRREHSPMLATLTSILMIVSVLLGGTGITVYAAQDSLPDQPLYGVKTWSEDFRVILTNDLQSKLDLDLELANRRVQEMAALSSSGVTPPDAVLTRLENHLNQTLYLAAGLDDDCFAPVMEKVRQAMQIQEQELIHAQVQAATPAEAQLVRARDMIQAHLRLVEDGLQDPLTFRERLRTREQLQIRQETCTPTGEGNQQRQQQRGPSQTQAGESFGPGPHMTITPTTGSGYGPGPGPNSTATAGSGSGYGPGPYVTGTPTPGSGYGPGPGPQPSATPQSGAGNGPGPGPTSESGDPKGPGPNPTDGSGGNNKPGPNPTPSLVRGGGGPPPRQSPS